MLIPLKYAKTGNSVCLVLPREAVAQLKAVVGETVYLASGHDGTATLTPYDADFDEQVDTARKVMRRYQNALRALAKR